jgi:16S rRNA (guanine527-N7)-methyltransferase
VQDPAAPLPEHLRPAATEVFGSRLGVAERYVEMLATDGVVRGLIGPRETPRIWDRHILNCAALAPLLSPNDAVIDVGSGAGLPGIVIAIARPDVAVTLLEPLSRRTVFLDQAVLDLGLSGQITVVRARAEEVAVRPSMFHVKPADVVTARAVAPLDRLAGWCLPLCAIGGRLLALKGMTAADEIVAHAAAITRMGGSVPVLHESVLDGLDPAIVVEVIRERRVAPGTTSRSRRD